MDTTLNTAQHLELIEWATQSSATDVDTKQPKRDQNTPCCWIVEDDYNNEFQFSHRRYTRLQRLTGLMGNDHHILYIGSFSKVLFNVLRLGYLIVPKTLVQKCLTIKEALSARLTIT
ncbi:MAG: GntR family transcriptional regulator/MocR family aminotransferase [Paraglaciecola sp.]|jgi:GntR family transcriptional regulator/MocR family aminotransferase